MLISSSTSAMPKVCLPHRNMYDRACTRGPGLHARYFHVCTAYFMSMPPHKAFPIKMQIKYFTRDLALLCTIHYCCKSWMEIAFLRVPEMHEMHEVHQRHHRCNDCIYLVFSFSPAVTSLTRERARIASVPKCLREFPISRTAHPLWWFRLSSSLENVVPLKKAVFGG